MEDKATEIGKLIGIEYAADTHVGMRREENQDSYGVIEKERMQFFMVADGMGGVKGGGIASKLAIEVVTQKLANRESLDEVAIASAVELANRQIFEKGRSDLELVGMGTTFVGLAFVGDQLYVVNVGDSRAYHLRHNEIVQLTDDHTLVMELVKSGALSIEQAQSSPCSHMLTRSLGPGHEVLVDCSIVINPPIRGDHYLLCTDGLYNLVSDEEIYTIIREYSVNKAVEKLIGLANQRGGTDNITVVVVKVGQEYLRGEPEILPVIQKMGRRVHSRSVESGSTEKEEQVLENAAGQDKISQPIIEPRLSIDQLVQVQEEALEKANQLEEALRRMAEAERLRQQLDQGKMGSILNRPVSTRATVSTLSLIFFAVAVIFGHILIGDKVAVEVGQIAESKSADRSLGDNNLDPAVNEGELLSGEEGIVLDPSNLAPFQELSSSEKDSILKRIETLRAFRGRLERRLKSLEQGDAVKVEVKRVIEKRVSACQQDLSRIQLQLETVTRKLAIWYGRRNRLRLSNPLNLANEVAVSSKAVREYKAEFENVTYEYLKNAEELKYDPTNEELQARIADLVLERRQRLEKLNEAIVKAVEDIILEVSKSIAELTLHRERVQSDLLDGLDELRYEEIQTGNDSKAKEQLKSELQERLKNTVAEIEELESILP